MFVSNLTGLPKRSRAVILDHDRKPWLHPRATNLAKRAMLPHSYVSPCRPGSVHPGPGGMALAKHVVRTRIDGLLGWELRIGGLNGVTGNSASSFQRAGIGQGPGFETWQPGNLAVGVWLLLLAVLGHASLRRADVPVLQFAARDFTDGNTAVLPNQPTLVVSPGDTWSFSYSTQNTLEWVR